MAGIYGGIYSEREAEKLHRPFPYPLIWHGFRRHIYDLRTGHYESSTAVADVQKETNGGEISLNTTTFLGRTKDVTINYANGEFGEGLISVHATRNLSIQGIDNLEFAELEATRKGLVIAELNPYAVLHALNQTRQTMLQDQ